MPSYSSVVPSGVIICSILIVTQWLPLIDVKLIHCFVRTTIYKNFKPLHIKVLKFVYIFINNVVCQFRIYVNSELTYVRSESISLPNWHMSDQNLYQFRTDICQIRIYVTSELTYVRSEFSMIYESSWHFASALFYAYVKLLDICMHTKIKLCWKGYQYLR